MNLSKKELFLVALWSISLIALSNILTSVLLEGRETEIRKGDLWIAEKIDEGDFWKVRGSWCGCCGSDFSGWLYAPKYLNLTRNNWYSLKVYGSIIIEAVPYVIEG